MMQRLRPTSPSSKACDEEGSSLEEHLSKIIACSDENAEAGEEVFNNFPAPQSNSNHHKAAIQCNFLPTQGASSLPMNQITTERRYPGPPSQSSLPYHQRSRNCTRSMIMNPKKATDTTISVTRRKQVRFHPTASVRLVEGRYEFTAEEKLAAWFSNEESQEIRRACIKQIHKIEQLGEAVFSVDSRKYCARGLEDKSGIRCAVKEKNRSLAIQSVLKEQQRQSQLVGTKAAEDSVSIYAIARVYHHASSSAQLWANTVGLRDQRVAEELFMEDESSLLDLLKERRYPCSFLVPKPLRSHQQFCPRAAGTSGSPNTGTMKLVQNISRTPSRGGKALTRTLFTL